MALVNAHGAGKELKKPASRREWKRSAGNCEALGQNTGTGVVLEGRARALPWQSERSKCASVSHSLLYIAHFFVLFLRQGSKVAQAILKLAV